MDLSIQIVWFVVSHSLYYPITLLIHFVLFE